MTTPSTIRIAPDHEFNAEEFWANFYDQFKDVAAWCDYGASAEVTIEQWEAIQKIEGFADGPSHAPHALIVVGEDE